jgi:hypothetical protein
MRGRGCSGAEAVIFLRCGVALNLVYRQVTAPVTSEASGDGCITSTSARLEVGRLTGLLQSFSDSVAIVERDPALCLLRLVRRCAAAADLG